MGIEKQSYCVYFTAFRRIKSGIYKTYSSTPIITGLKEKKANDICTNLNRDLHRANYVGNGYYAWKPYKITK